MFRTIGPNLASDLDLVRPVAQAVKVNVTFDYALGAAFVDITLIILVATYFRTSIKR